MTEASIADVLTIELRAQLVRSRLTSADVGRALSKSQAQISARMTGRQQWRVNELFAVADLCGVPLSRLVAAAEASVSAAEPPARSA